MAKIPTPKKSTFAKAADILIQTYPRQFFHYSDGELRCGDLEFRGLSSAIVCSRPGSDDRSLPIAETTDLGDVLQFIHKTVASLDPCSPPDTLGGNGKELEELLMNEAKRLEKDSILTMGRYGTMVSMVDDAWLPVPSLPDFDGARANGRQFIIEAKVCSQPSFRIQNDKIKQKQLRHMLKRSRFNVDCYVLIHFNARLGRTFYEPAFTVAMPILDGACGWAAGWAQFAECKEKYTEFPGLTRQLAQELGIPVKWHIPPRSNKLRPDLLGLVGAA
jgi:hypothetical protein